MLRTESASPEFERNRLIRLCAHLTGHPDAAEDLAQETLLIAWQQKAQLREEAKYPQWVTGIARNLCLHWLRSQRREKRYRYGHAEDNALEALEQHQAEAENFDLELVLERHELAHLLDRALAHLPPLTRTVLIERFIHETPQADVAQRLGLTEGAVEARVQRGKLTMRRVLMTALLDEAAAYGLIVPANGVMQTTKIWCPNCGQRYLQGCFGPETLRSLLLQCTCGANAGIMDIPGLLDGVHGFRAAYTRMSKWHYAFWQQVLQVGQVACPRCNQAMHLQLLPTTTTASAEIQVHCQACQQWPRQTDIVALAHHYPEVQQFWRAHPRMYTLPVRVVEVTGRPALLVTFQAVNGHAELELLFDCTTLTRLVL